MSYCIVVNGSAGYMMMDGATEWPRQAFIMNATDVDQLADIIVSLLRADCQISLRLRVEMQKISLNILCIIMDKKPQ